LYHISSTTFFASPSIKDEKLSSSLIEISSNAFLRALQSHILPICQQLRFKNRTQVLGLALQLIGLTSDEETAVEIIFNLLIHPALPSPNKSYSSDSKGVVGIGGNLSQNSHTLNVDGRTGVSEERSYHLRLVAESMKLLSLEHSQVQQKAISRFFNSIEELPSDDVIETLEDLLYLIHFHRAQSSKTESEGEKDGGISFAAEIASHWARLLSFVLHSHNSALREISFDLISFILSLRRTKEKGTEETSTTVTLSNTKNFDVDVPHHVWSKQSSSSSSEGVSIISKFDTYLICRSLLNVFFTLVDLLEDPRGNHGEHLRHVEEEERILQHTIELSKSILFLLSFSMLHQFTFTLLFSA
jgi:hypothetical protein